MKVGVVTFHFAKNFGAMLQAYAMCQAVRSLGADCEVIDYRYPVMYRGEGRISLYEQYFVHRRWNPVLPAIAKGLVRWVLSFLRKDSVQAKKYRQFMNHEIPLSRRVRDRDLPLLAYDAYICGSDQIWNARITSGLCPAYFCEFAKQQNARKVAYAASCGKGEFPLAMKDEVISLLKNFDAIGVREDSLCTHINETMDLIPKAVHVLDPTLLLDRKDWQSIAVEPSFPGFATEKYLLIYLVEETPAFQWVYALARKIASARKLKIVKIARPSDVCGDSLLDVTSITDCGPQEFLGLIQHAGFVLAGSFHGLVFSILFNRQFCCIPHMTCRARTDSLLEMLGLNSRNASEVSESSSREIVFDQVNETLGEKRSESLIFLKQAIGL